eukprot:sb/3476900/
MSPSPQIDPRGEDNEGPTGELYNYYQKILERLYAIDENVPTGAPTDEPPIIWYHAVVRWWVIDDTPTITVEEENVQEGPYDVQENQERQYDGVQQQDDEEDRPVVQAVAYALN